MKEETHTVEQKSKKRKTHQLWWVDKSTNKGQHAGVAFYNEDNGTYNLYLSFYPRNRDWRLRLSPFESLNDTTLYRVEKTVRIKNSNFKRVKVGEGISSRETNGSIHIDLGPHNKILVLPFIKD